MIVGRDFAWGHMGKTGGDAVWAMFRCLPDLVEFAHEPTDPAKHRTFEQMNVLDRRLVLNLRRLPSLVLSYVNHARNYGLDATLPAGTVLTPDEACVFPRPERMIRNHTSNGTLPIHRWLRMERLREDFLQLAASLRPLGQAEIEAIRTVPTKPPMAYDHDWSRFFTRAQVETMYRVSPTWARYERAVYGSLPIDEPAPSPRHRVPPLGRRTARPGRPVRVEDRPGGW